MEQFPIKTYDPKKGKFVLAGFLSGDTFHKDCTKKTHYMIAYRGYGMQNDVLDILSHRGVTTVCIETKKEILTSTLEDWVAYGVHDNNQKAHGHQVFLAISPFMQSEKKNAKKA